MSEQRYNVVFQGELVDGADLAAVQENIARLFKMDRQKVEALFTGKKVVLRKDADQATAMKLRAAMKQAGARCDMVAVGADSAAPAPVQKPETAPSPATNRAVFAPQEPGAQTPASAAREGASSGELETVGTIRTGGTGFSGPFDVAPAGTDIADARDDSDVEVPDISHLSMAPPGTDLEELPRSQKAVNPDISHLSIANDQ